MLTVSQQQANERPAPIETNFCDEEKTPEYESSEEEEEAQDAVSPLPAHAAASPFRSRGSADDLEQTPVFALTKSFSGSPESFARAALGAMPESSFARPTQHLEAAPPAPAAESWEEAPPREEPPPQRQTHEQLALAEAQSRALALAVALAADMPMERPHRRPSLGKPIPLEVFIAVFRIDPDQLADVVLDRLRVALAMVRSRVYTAQQTVTVQGDTHAPDELLVFVDGAIDVLLAPPPAHHHNHHRYHGGPGAGKLRRHSATAAPTSMQLQRAAVAPDPSDLLGHADYLLRPDTVPEPRAPSEKLAATLRSPFFIGEDRVLSGSWPTATYRVTANGPAACYVFDQRALNGLVATGGFNLERTLRLRAFERTLAKHGMHTSVLRDATFVDHFMAFLAHWQAAEDLRFLVDLMRFKRDNDPRTSDHATFLVHFDALWKAYMNPWGTMANVCSLDCNERVLKSTIAAHAQALRDSDAPKLASVLDEVATRIKEKLDQQYLPLFVSGRLYTLFLNDRFPMRDAAALGTPTAFRRKSILAGVTSMNAVVEGIGTPQHRGFLTRFLLGHGANGGRGDSGTSSPNSTHSTPSGGRRPSIEGGADHPKSEIETLRSRLAVMTQELDRLEAQNNSRNSSNFATTVERPTRRPSRRPSFVQHVAGGVHAAIRGHHQHQHEAAMRRNFHKHQQDSAACAVC